MGIEAMPSKMNLFRSLTKWNVDQTRLYIQELCMLLVEFKRFWSLVKTVWSKSYESHLGAIYFFLCLLKIASDNMCEGKFQPCLRPMWDEEWGPMCSMCKPEEWELSHSVQRSRWQWHRLCKNVTPVTTASTRGLSWPLLTQTWGQNRSPAKTGDRLKLNVSSWANWNSWVQGESEGGRNHFWPTLSKDSSWLDISFLTSFVRFCYLLNNANSVFYSDQLESETLIFGQSQFLPPSNSPCFSSLITKSGSCWS